MKKDKRKENISQAELEDTGMIIGRSAVRELLQGDREIDKILIQKGERQGSIVQLFALAREKRIPIVEAEKLKLDQLAQGAAHQGIIAFAAQKEYVCIDDILEIAAQRNEKPLILVADGIEDVHNLGALIRVAEASGAHGLILPKRRSAPLNMTAIKASAGAIEHLAIAKVTNIPTAIDELKKKNVWVFAAEGGGEDYTKTDFNCPAAIVLGSEGFGVSRLVKDKCDYTVSIPMYGKVNSLNVSTAASVIMFRAAEMQRKV